MPKDMVSTKIESFEDITMEHLVLLTAMIRALHDGLSCGKQAQERACHRMLTEINISSQMKV